METSWPLLPDFRGDETLYSWAGGFHAVCGNGSARDTGHMLYGSEHACRERDAPANLFLLVQRTGGMLGTVEQLLRERTLMGLFAAFMPAHRRQLWRARLQTNEPTAWQTHFYLPASSLVDFRQQRFCQVCIEEDRSRWELPRWRLPHQLPGAWVCVEHERPLRYASQRRSTWTLPSLESADREGEDPSVEQVCALVRLADLARRSSMHPELDLGATRRAALEQMRNIQLIAWGVPLDSGRLARWFSGSVIASWLRHASGPEKRLACGSWIYGLLRGRSGDHPLKWLVLWSALFQDHEQELSARKLVEPAVEPCWDIAGQGNMFEISGGQLPAGIQQVVLDAPTLLHAAKRLGVSTWTLRRRLKKIGGHARQHRELAREQERLDAAVAAIAGYVGRHPDASASVLHGQFKAEIAWLTAHAPDILDQLMGQRLRQRRQLDLW